MSPAAATSSMQHHQRWPRWRMSTTVGRRASQISGSREDMSATKILFLLLSFRVKQKTGFPVRKAGCRCFVRQELKQTASWHTNATATATHLAYKVFPSHCGAEDSPCTEGSIEENKAAYQCQCRAAGKTLQVSGPIHTGRDARSEAN